MENINTDTVNSINKNKKRLGAAGVALSLYYLFMMINLLDTMGFLLKVELKAIREFSFNSLAYYSARAALEYGMAATTSASTAERYIGKVDGGKELYCRVEVYNSSDTLYNTYERLKRLTSVGTTYMVSGTGWIKIGGVEKSKKTLQCVYQVSPNRVIAWRELFSDKGDKHRFLANHD